MSIEIYKYFVHFPRPKLCVQSAQKSRFNFVKTSQNEKKQKNATFFQKSA